MKQLLLIAGISAAFAITTPVFAMPDAECAAAWTKADVDKDGIVTEREGERYFATLRIKGMPVVDGKLPQAAFLEHCKADHFTVAKLDVGAPLAGSNSFTEAQAKDRIMAAGYSSVKPLKKDAQGIWRGSALDGSKTVSVAVDYKGNVVAK